MPYCTNCGKKFKEEMKFCPHCGTPNALMLINQEQQVDQVADDYEEFVTLRRDVHVSYGALSLDNLPEGHLIEDRYEVLEKVGQGGFGTVYRVHDRVMDISKAIKVIPEAITHDAEAMFDLQKEAQTMIALNHTNIVRVYDFHTSGAVRFIDMEFVDGNTLTEKKLNYEGKQIPETIVREYALKIARGLSYAHQHNVLHKDIKPQNIKVNSQNEIKIMDFGIAETVRTSMSRIHNASAAGSSGTLVYMSPEQIKGKDVGKESDIYSFGAMLYELLSGRPPFYRGAIEHQILHEEPQPLPSVSADLNEVIATCLKKDFRDRFSDFDECILALGGTVQERSGPLILPEKQVALPGEAAPIPGMVFVAGKEYVMGSIHGKEEERPIHKVLLHDFYIEITTVTQKEWRKVMEENPSDITGDDIPVHNVSWYDAVEYCNRRSKRDNLTPCYTILKERTDPNNKCRFDTRKWLITCDFNADGYRLPTEAEWEYAARGADPYYSYTYSGSNTLNNVGWFTDNAGKMLHPVATRTPNELGLYDLSGNIWEWCWDWYDKTYYQKSSRDFPTGASRGVSRVIRGGSWRTGEELCSVSCRGLNFPCFISRSIGFRVVRSSK